MIVIEALSDISKFANFEVYHFGEKEIIIYDDHRCILTVLFEARKLGLIDDLTNLITFDMHDDAKPVHPDTTRLLRELQKSDLSDMPSCDFKSFVEFDICNMDDDWVTVGMELGLINNIVNIGCEENFNIREWQNNFYVDMNQKEHSGFVIGHLRDELNRHGGRIADMTLQENDRIRKILGYVDSGVYPYIQEGINFVLDFDLDCFTTICMSERYAWLERIFHNEYVDNEAGYFIHELIRNAKFITICREPSYCGGIGETNRILGYLDKYFFMGSLGTISIK